MSTSTITRIRNVLAAALTTGLLLMGSACAQAEAVRMPANLQWKVMSTVILDFPTGPGTASAGEIRLAEQIWHDELQARPENKSKRDGSIYPAFILVAEVERGSGETLVFSSMSSAHLNYTLCEPPANGRGAYDMYSTCQLRVSKVAGGQIRTHAVDNFCHLTTNSPENPTELNHIEYAFDAKTSMAYFRLIQYGKQVQACDRRIAIK